MYADVVSADDAVMISGLAVSTSTTVWLTASISCRLENPGLPSHVAAY